MAELTFKSAGVSVREIDLSGPSDVQPVGVPAGIIGTANTGPAFVPVTLATTQDFFTRFGESDGEKFGPIAVSEWLSNARAATFLRVLGVGNGEKRSSSTGVITNAGFVVGEEQPQTNGGFGNNTYANATGASTGVGELGRLYFLGCYMSESAGSTAFSQAGIAGCHGFTTGSRPIVRGVLLVASGVVLRLSSSAAGVNTAPAAAAVGHSDAAMSGYITGSVKISSGLQEFVIFLNGHKGTDLSYPNLITASFDPAASNYFGKIFNKDPYKIEEAGHLLYTQYDIHQAVAKVTGSGLVKSTFGADSTGGFEEVAFVTTGTLARSVDATATVPNYESFEERFATAKTPYIISQRFGGRNLNLFRIHALSDGATPNTQFKISIENLAASNTTADRFGAFDLVVRSFDDNDDNKVALEQFRGLSLNPSSDRYIARIIGDQHTYFDFDKSNGSQRLVVDGKYPNKSHYIRVEMADSVENNEIDEAALPVGFKGHAHLVTSGSAPLTNVSGSGNQWIGNPLQHTVEPPIPFRSTLATGTSSRQVANRNFYWGVQFENVTSVDEPNKTLTLNETIKSYTKFFPSFSPSGMNVSVGDNTDAADSTTNGIIDADRFNNNKFTLENVQAQLDENDNLDFKNLHLWQYVRNGNITDTGASGHRALDPTTDFTNVNLKPLLKFTLFLQGGFDGTNIMNKNEHDISNIAVTQDMEFAARGQTSGPAVKAYRKAIDIMGNTTDVDIQLLAVPGIREPIITDAATSMVENRFDAMYVMDIEEYPIDSISTPVTSSLQDVSVKNTSSVFSLRGLDTSFAAAYFPDVNVVDPTLGTIVKVPPSVSVLGAMSYNDSVSFPWFAPAGYARGALKSATGTALSLNRTNMDTLYDVDINPIVSFPGSNEVVIWGQKTLNARQSAFDRVNVRRLLINLRRQIKSVGNSLLFEPNRESTLSRFSALVNPIMTKVQEQQGVERFRVQIDTSTTTQADVENNTIRGKIFLAPTKSAEFIALDFTISNTGKE